MNDVDEFAATIDGPDPEEAVYGKPLQPGTRVAEYVVDDLAGRGGYSTVYRVRHAETGAPAALKVLHSYLSSQSPRFFLEAGVVARLRHPGLVAVLGSGTLEGGQPFMLMEWLEGRDLSAELAARGPLSPDEALAVVEALGGALEVAHRSGVIHRDLKAQNVMCVPAGDWFAPRLVDFGIAKLLENDTQLTRTGETLGTPTVMAPEQIQARRDLDARVDVYALGALLFRMVTGRQPFNAPTVVEMQEAHLHLTPPAASSFAPVSPAIDAVIFRCMEKDRERRYPTVAEVVEDLRRAVRDRGASRGVAVHVEAAVEGVDADDEIYDELDAVLAVAREIASGAGLAVELETSSALVAAALCPADGAPLRRRALAAGLEIAARARLASPRVRVAVTVHAAPATSRDRRLGGELMKLAEWTGDHPGHGLVASRAALDGLDGYTLDPLRAGFYRVR